MPDRELTEEETRKFIEEHDSGELLKALEIIKKEKIKPTLHDLCIIELSASLDGMRQIIIQQGREIERLKKKKHWRH